MENWVKQGSINTEIGNEYLDFPYIKQNLTNKEELNKWRSQGYTHDTFLGSLYNSKNPMPEWVEDVSNELGLSHCGYTFYKMAQLEIMPPHVDHFQTYCKRFKLERSIDKVCRAIIFIEDWKPGHYFEAEGKAIVNWKRGDYVIYSTDVEHAASNIGIEPRYTLQITGLWTKK